MAKAIIGSLAFLALEAFLLASGTSAFAAEKQAKPVACAEYEIIRNARGAIAICYSGKSPRILVRFAEALIPGYGKVVVGYTKREGE